MKYDLGVPAVGGCRWACVALACAALFVTGTVQASILSQYDFTDVVAGALNRSATTVAANVLAGDITDAPIVNTRNTIILSRTTGVGYSTEPVLSAARDQWGEAAVPDNVYFTFDVAPDAGYELGLSSLTFNVARGGGATPRTYDVRTSLDGFANSLTGVVEVNTQRTTFTPVSVDLSGNEFQNLTTPLTFQIRIFAPTAYQSLDFDNITVNGEAALAVPEPATLSLVAVVGCLMLLHRRNK